MRSPSGYLLLLLLILILILNSVSEFPRIAEGGKRRIHITDDLDDVVDDEEDESWKEWGSKKKKKSSLGDSDPPPSDLSEMSMEEIQEVMMKTQSGPVFGFAKLRLGVRRTPDMVAEIAMKWSKVSRTGGIEVKFMGVDLSTIMFNMEQGRDMMELKEFVLNQPEAYEVKIGDQVFRRPGDPPLEQVIEKLQAEKERAKETPKVEDSGHLKEEL